MAKRLGTKRLRSVAVLAIPVVMLQQCAQECAPESSGGGWGGTPGNCATDQDDMARVGLPVSTFTYIMKRESGCNPNLWTHDRDDDGGAGFGLNYIGNMGSYWQNLCGMSKSEAKQGNSNFHQIISCVKAEYSAHGTRAWS